MLERTSTEHAPWHLVQGDSKRYGRVRVMETTIGEIERGMRDRGFEPPAAPRESVEGKRAKGARPSKAKAKARKA
jgi:hypothetical protein